MFRKWETSPIWSFRSSYKGFLWFGLFGVEGDEWASLVYVLSRASKSFKVSMDRNLVLKLWLRQKGFWFSTTVLLGFWYFKGAKISFEFIDFGYFLVSCRQPLEVRTAEIGRTISYVLESLFSRLLSFLIWHWYVCIHFTFFIGELNIAFISLHFYTPARWIFFSWNLPFRQEIGKERGDRKTFGLFQRVNSN